MLSYCCPLSTMMWKHSQAPTVYFYPLSYWVRKVRVQPIYTVSRKKGIDITNPILKISSLKWKKGSVVNERRGKKVLKSSQHDGEKIKVEWLHLGRRGNKRSSRASKWVQRIFAIFMCLHRSATDGSDRVGWKAITWMERCESERRVTRFEWKCDDISKLAHSHDMEMNLLAREWKNDVEGRERGNRNWWNVRRAS